MNTSIIHGDDSGQQKQTQQQKNRKLHIGNHIIYRRIRKRPISFGNPALGTYHGYVYTYEPKNEIDDNYNVDINSNNGDASRIDNKPQQPQQHRVRFEKQIEHRHQQDDDKEEDIEVVRQNVEKDIEIFQQSIEKYANQRQQKQQSTSNNSSNSYKEEAGDSNSVDISSLSIVPNMVAMVNIPPEQVPEGILNISRSYRQYIKHLRIVIGDASTTANNESSFLTIPQPKSITRHRTVPNTKKKKTKSVKSESISSYSSVESNMQKMMAPSTANVLSTTTPTQNITSSSLTMSLSPSACAAETAASILAHQEAKDKHQQEKQMQYQIGDDDKRVNQAHDGMFTKNNDQDVNTRNREVRSRSLTYPLDDYDTNYQNQLQRQLQQLNTVSDSDDDDVEYEFIDYCDSKKDTNSLDLGCMENKRNTKNRTYVALIELCDDDDDDNNDIAEQFVKDLHQQPYTILDEKEVSSIYHVVAVQGEDGVSVTSPFFASSNIKNKNNNNKILTVNASTKSSSPIHATVCDDHYSCAVCLENVDLDHISATTSVSCRLTNKQQQQLQLQLTSKSAQTAVSSTSASLLTTVCNHTFHLDCILQWQDSPCPVCRYDHSGLNEALSECHICGTTENNYVCLICGVVSCGSGGNIAGGIDEGYNIDHSTAVTTSSGYMNNANILDFNNHIVDDGITSSQVATTGRNSLLSTQTPSRYMKTDACSVCDVGDNGDNRIESITDAVSVTHAPPSTHRTQHLTHANSHARRHYEQTLHAYALSTETQHVWDFAGQGYVHRLLQNKDDGKLVEVNDPNNTSSQERSLQPGLTDAEEGEVVHRKLEGYATQYYTLLKSQLEQQRIFYESRLDELRREYEVSSSSFLSTSNIANSHIPSDTCQSIPRKKKVSIDLINALKQERGQLRNRLQSLTCRLNKVKDDVTFLINMNESLEANRTKHREQIEQEKQNQIEQRTMFEQHILPPLQENVTQLMLQLEQSATETQVEESTASKKDSKTNTNNKTNNNRFSNNDDRKPAARRR